MPRIPIVLSRWTTVAFFSLLSILGACGDSGTGPSDDGEPFALESITRGIRHTCGLSPAGMAYCWGWNGAGQLGDGTTTDGSTPVAVAGDLTFRSLVAGDLHNCGITTDDVTWCWGSNDGGRLGDGTTADRGFPVRVVGGPQLVSLSLGGGASCGLTAAGAAYCWGRNTFGQFGNGKEVVEGACALSDIVIPGNPWPYCTSPVPAAFGLTLRTLKPGSSNACGLTLEGQAYCWGRNTSGQLGDGTTTDRLSPAPVASNLSYADLSVASWYACALRDDGVADWDCWGHLDSAYKQLEADTPMGATTPAPLAPGIEFRSVSVGGQVACGLTDEGAAYCWGDHLHGALGDGTVRDRFNPNDRPSMTPRLVLGEHTFETVSAGFYGACGLTAEGVAYCWGYNEFGQLGDGTTVDRAEPVVVRAPS
jgi:alpha-tubulin suppressor-like RCC1 family protein